MTDEKVALVPTSSMSFEKHIMVLRAYVVMTDRGKNPIHYKRIVKSARVARTQVSGVNSFFVSLGFIDETEKGTYLPRKEVVDFFSEQPGKEDFSKLRPLLKTSPIFTLVKNMILIHGNISYNEMIGYLLEESGESTKSRAKRTIEWLLRTDLIDIDPDEKIIVKDNI